MPFVKPQDWNVGSGPIQNTTPHLEPNIADKAVDLVLGERNQAYGSPLKDYQKTAKIWSGLLIHHLKEGVEITPKEVCLMMAALKLSREIHGHKQDNLVDVIGYSLLAEWIETGEKPTN